MNLKHVSQPETVGSTPSISCCKKLGKVDKLTVESEAMEGSLWQFINLMIIKRLLIDDFAKCGSKRSERMPDEFCRFEGVRVFCCPRV